MAPPSKKSRTRKVPPAQEESTPADPPAKKIQTSKKARPTKNKESTSIEPPTKKKRTPVDPPTESGESTPMDPPTKKKQTTKAPPTKNKEPTSIEPPTNKKKKTPVDPPTESGESTPMDPPTKKKQTSKKARPTKNKESTTIEPPANKKKQTPIDPSAKTEESTPMDPPTKKKVTPKAPPAKKDSTSKAPAKKKSPKTPAPSTNVMAPVASSSTAGQRVWKCPTGPMTEEQIQRILDKLQCETIHSYKCKQKKLKDLKAMNEMITLYPHRLEQPNAFYDNRGQTGLMLRSDMPHLITPLGDAACRGHLKCAEILLSRGANPNAVTTGTPRRGITILEAFMLWSRLPNHLDMLSLLVSHGASLRPEDNNGRDMVYEAVRLGEVGTVQFLLDNGLEVKNVDPDTVLSLSLLGPPVTSPLQKALYGYHFDIAKLLLLHGATFSRNDWRVGKPEEKLTIPELLVNIAITSREDLWYFPDKRDKQEIAIEKAPLRLLTSLKMYRIFGGKLGNILDYLNTVKKGEVFNSVRAELQELVSHPLNLKSMTRLVVKKCMGKDYLKNIKNLAVPDEVEQFLRFEDVVTEC